MIDTTTFALDIASGTAVTAGQEIPLRCIDGPANVRSGRGAAILKRMTSFRIGTAGIGFLVKVKNSDWVDPMINEMGTLAITTLDRRTGGYQNGNDCPLTPNSSWEVVAVALASGTTSGDCSLCALIDIDYPSVSSIVDPERLTGIPASITVEQSFTTSTPGNLESTPWVTSNVDIFKAGFVYALQKCSCVSGSSGQIGFISLSNAAGMGGLKRVIPCYIDANTICSIIEYASTLQKGPMDIGFKFFETTATSRTFTAIFDFVKRKV